MLRAFTKSIACIAILVTAIFTSAIAQSNPAPEPGPTPYLGRRETGLERIRRQDRQHDRLAQQTYANLYGQGAYANSRRYGPKWRAAMVALYREPKDKETALLDAGEPYQKKYAEFLSQKRTGLIKLVPFQGCGEKAKVISVSPKCLKYDFPGSGSSYSFRLGSYRIRRLADITYFKKSLIARGVLNGAIFVALGDVPIENVGLKTPGVGFLSRYKPVKTPHAAMEAAKRFAQGVKRDGFIYGRGVHVGDQNTFVMRSIAYRGKFLRSEAGVVYNELDFDKRRDIVVAFRIEKVEKDGSATIVWKILRESKSPKLKIDSADK
ncbi:MAG: hypothetical protein HKN25_04860 [Pyrinomonadaceae bacterium]|nr:hypothetical protein [Pyrinomonadaceae bacterium]